MPSDSQAGKTSPFKNSVKTDGGYEISGSYKSQSYTINGSKSGQEITYDFSQADLTDCVVTIKGDRIKIVGGHWKNSMVEIEGNDNRVTQALFSDGKPGGNKDRLHAAVSIIGDSSRNRADHNEVTKWDRRAFRCTKLTPKTKGNIFEYNWIHVMKPQRKVNGGEALQSGKDQTDALQSPGTIIRFNVVEDFNADSEVISLKSSGNTVQFNTFVNAEGRVTTRQGSNCVISGNTFIRSWGVGIMGDQNDNTVGIF